MRTSESVGTVASGTAKEYPYRSGEDETEGGDRPNCEATDVHIDHAEGMLVVIAEWNSF